ncbi:hypothetical protein BLGI_443 [Brevibacillus laterosporus GI-9]|nr:hypothetical protein BLGI_443 [Brevibacillus laterosporus GI-9]
MLPSISGCTLPIKHFQRIAFLIGQLASIANYMVKSLDP